MPEDIKYISKKGDNNDIVDFFEQKLEEKGKLSQAVQVKLQELRKDLKNCEYVIKEGKEICPFDNKINFTKLDSDEFKSDLGKFLLENPDNQQANFVNNLYDFLFKIGREEQIESKFLEKSQDEIWEEFDSKKFERKINRAGLEVIDKFRGKTDYTIVFFSQAHVHEIGQIETQMVHKNIFKGLGILYKMGISNMVGDELSDEKFNIKDPQEIYGESCDMKEMISFFNDNSSLNERLLLNGAAHVFEMKNHNNIQTYFIENSIPRDEIIKKNRIYNSFETDLNSYKNGKNEALLYLEDYTKVFDANLLNSSGISTKYKEFLNIISQKNKEEISKFIEETILWAQNNQVDFNYNDFRQKNALENIKILNDKKKSPCISMIFGAYHFIKGKIKGVPTFQEMCKEKGISYIILEPKSIKVKIPRN